MCYTVDMDDFFSQGQIQSQKQAQVQVMSQQQIHALKILSMDTGELIDEISSAAKENPVLIIDDRISDRDFTSDKKIRKSEKISPDRQKSSDAYQAIMEQTEDTRESLKEHLLHQLHMERIGETEIALSEKLIHNLDEQGHHILEPETLLDKKNPAETISLLKKCLHMIQTFDPTGTCTKNIEESLLVQAKENPRADGLSIFLLDGHLDFINPPNPARATKKIKSYFAERKNMFGLSENEKSYLDMEVTEEDVQKSIDFIKSLTPFPASRFSTDEPHLISPDIYVTRIAEDSLDVDADSEEKLRLHGILKTGRSYWKISVKNSSIPKISLAPEIQVMDTSKKELKEKIRSAQEFIEMLENRKNTIEKSAWEIVRIQHDFFEHGEGHLVPLRLKDLAKLVGISESTASRMANGKYLDYNGSLYPLKFFFENSVAVNKPEDDSSNENLSRDKVKMEIKKILEEHKDDKKKLSDQKISDLLEERGMKIARRTVAKYRGQLNIDSSYDR